MSDVLVPHFALPLRLDGSSFAVVEQDSDEDILQAVAVLTSTVQGSRLELPDYGVPDVLFSDPIDVTGIADAVDEWEPRATVSIDDTIDSADDLLRYVTINVED